MKHLYPHPNNKFTMPMNRMYSIFDSIRNYYHINAPDVNRVNIIYDI